MPIRFKKIVKKIDLNQFNEAIYTWLNNLTALSCMANL
jgi:hypothetical protein